MTEPSPAVFLGCASQDAQAAQRICEALRAAGIEVWSDQSELRREERFAAFCRKVGRPMPGEAAAHKK